MTCAFGAGGARKRTGASSTIGAAKRAAIRYRATDREIGGGAFAIDRRAGGIATISAVAPRSQIGRGGSAIATFATDRIVVKKSAICYAATCNEQSAAEAVPTTRAGDALAVGGGSAV